MALFWTFSLAAQPLPQDSSSAFQAPRAVTITGYQDDAMEPFLSRDGQLLFFNNRNTPPVNTDIHYATRIDDVTFAYQGRVEGVNTTALEGVPTMDASGHFYFISPRDYGETKSTIFTGNFHQGRVTGVRHPQGDLSLGKPLWFNMDVEVSADGETIYATDNHKPLFGGSGPDVSDLFIAHKAPDGTLLRDRGSDNLLKNINERGALQYGAGISADELTLYFSRARPHQGEIGIYVATRSSRTEPFGRPSRIDAIQGFVEAPTVTPDDCAIYFHKKVADRFQIFRADRKSCAASRKP